MSQRETMMDHCRVELSAFSRLLKTPRLGSDFLHIFAAYFARTATCWAWYFIQAHLHLARHRRMQVHQLTSVKLLHADFSNLLDERAKLHMFCTSGVELCKYRSMFQNQVDAQLQVVTKRPVLTTARMPRRRTQLRRLPSSTACPAAYSRT